MPSFRNGPYDALIEVLVARRRAQKLKLRQVAVRMPAWLGWDFTTLHKIEKRRRNISFIEARELCEVLGLTVSDLDSMVRQLDNARSDSASAGDTKRSRKKR